LAAKDTDAALRQAGYRFVAAQPISGFDAKTKSAASTFAFTGYCRVNDPLIYVTGSVERYGTWPALPHWTRPSSGSPTAIPTSHPTTKALWARGHARQIRSCLPLACRIALR